MSSHSIPHSVWLLTTTTKSRILTEISRCEAFIFARTQFPNWITFWCCVLYHRICGSYCRMLVGCECHPRRKIPWHLILRKLYDIWLWNKFIKIYPTSGGTQFGERQKRKMKIKISSRREEKKFIYIILALHFKLNHLICQHVEYYTKCRPRRPLYTQTHSQFYFFLIFYFALE